MAVVCYLGIGSNLGNRYRYIKQAIQKIDSLKDTRVLKVSKIIQTSPVGGLPQGKFLNAALKITTNLSPQALLGNLQKIERQLGRPRIHPYHGPRTIDLDILFYANRVIKSSRLTVPHPGITEREFVMRPLLEII